MISTDENPLLCTNPGSCKKGSNKIVINVVPSVGVALILLTLVLIVVWRLRRQQGIGCTKSMILFYKMGRRKLNNWQSMDKVLALFGDRVSLARRRYREYLKKGIDQGQRADLVGGGLVHSTGGWAAVRSMRKAGVFLKSDERILGSSDFVDGVLLVCN